MPLVSLRAYARHRGVTLGAVQTAIKAQRISTVGGKIDQDQADKDWTANTGFSASKRGVPIAKKRSSKKAAKTKKAQTADTPQTRQQVKAKRTAPNPATITDEKGEIKPPGKEPPDKPADIWEERLWTEYYDRKLKALQVKQKEGELVSSAQVEKDWFDMGRLIRNKLQNIPSRLSAVLASMTEPAEVHDRLERELDLVLTDLASS